MLRNQLAPTKWKQSEGKLPVLCLLTAPVKLFRSNEWVPIQPLSLRKPGEILTVCWKWPADELAGVKLCVLRNFSLKLGHVIWNFKSTIKSHAVYTQSEGRVNQSASLPSLLWLVKPISIDAVYQHCTRLASYSPLARVGMINVFHRFLWTPSTLCFLSRLVMLQQKVHRETNKQNVHDANVTFTIVIYRRSGASMQSSSALLSD